MFVLIALALVWILIPINIRLSLVIFIIVLLFNAVLSYGVVGDFFTYQRIFDVLVSGIHEGKIQLFYSGVEPVMYFLANATHSLGLNAHFLIALYILSGSIIIIRSYLKVSKNYFFLFLMALVYVNVFYFMSITFIRQFLAASIIFYGLVTYIKDKQLLKYLLICAVASTIHISAILCIVLPIACSLNIKYGLKPIILLFIIAFLSIFINPVQYLAVLLPPELGKFSKYLTGDMLEFGQKIYALVNTVILMIVFQGIYFLGGKKKELSDFEKASTNFFFCIIITRVISISIPSFSRLVIYLYPFIAIYIYYFLFIKLKLSYKLVFIYVLLFLSIVKIGVLSEINNYDAVVYNFCFNSEPCPTVIWGDMQND